MLAVHREITNRRTEVLGSLGPKIIAAVFGLPEKGFGNALDISNANLVQLEGLSSAQPSNVDLNYLKLACTYILQNPDRVNAWVELDRKASPLMLLGALDNVRDMLLDMAPVDQQSLASMKLYAALHSVSDELIQNYLDKNMTSPWTQNRLLFPLIYYSINLPDLHALNQLLDHAFPAKGTGPAEKILTRFLLEPWRQDGVTLAFRSYVAMLSHPYDALDYIVTDLEHVCAEGIAASDAYLHQFDLLATAFPGHRVAFLAALARKKRLQFAQKPKTIFGIDFSKNAKLQNALLQILDIDARSAPKGGPENCILRLLVNARWSKYPNPSEFDLILSFPRKFAVLTSGRLVRHIATSLFLFSREDAKRERINLLDGITLVGHLTPFALTGPQGYNCVSTNRFPSEQSRSKIHSEISRSFTRVKQIREDRVWIKDANWAAAKFQQEGRIEKWMEQAHNTFPIWIAPRYLSGLDWEWWTGVISAFGLKNFVGQHAAIYILFLKQLEELRRESLSLRIVIEPLVRNKSFPEIKNWLFEQFSEDSSAFVRTVLTADTIQKLRLTDNYVASVSYRIALFEQCAREFGFKLGVLEERDLANERDTLTAVLCRMSIGAQQFEIGWTTLAVHSEERVGDAYSAYETMLNGMLSDGQANMHRTSTYQYSNGSTGHYEAKASDWPLVLVVGGIVDTFLTHPTSGIEAILSVRIRHDALRREFETAIQKVMAGSVRGVYTDNTKILVKHFEPEIYREVQRWIDQYMHATRKSKSQAFFDFVPSKTEMSYLVSNAVGKPLPQVIMQVLSWLRPKLDNHLETARASLLGELSPNLEKRVEIVRARLLAQKEPSDQVKRVADAIGGTVARRCNELQEWFKVPETDRSQMLTLAEVMNAVAQRFSPELSSKRLIWRPIGPELASRVLAPEQVRHAYDLLSEVAHNALKHSKIDQTTIRLTIKNKGGVDFVILSNRASQHEQHSSTIDGHPVTSVHESLFSEINSGMSKIASIAATIIDQPVTMSIERRLTSFHLSLPIGVFGQRVSA